VEICIGTSDDDVTIRFRDNGGGIKLECIFVLNPDVKKVWEYSFTTVESLDDDDFLSSQSKMSMVQSSGGPIAGVILQ
jgi:hypothetical protein